VIAVETIANILRLGGLVVSVVGLWYLAGGMRVVVSGRIDERQRSSNSLKVGMPLLLTGLCLLSFGIWLAKWAHL
jgi:hypothetical protein